MTIFSSECVQQLDSDYNGCFALNFEQMWSHNRGRKIGSLRQSFYLRLVCNVVSSFAFVVVLNKNGGHGSRSLAHGRSQPSQLFFFKTNVKSIIIYASANSPTLCIRSGYGPVSGSTRRGRRPDLTCGRRSWQIPTCKKIVFFNGLGTITKCKEHRKR